MSAQITILSFCLLCLGCSDLVNATKNSQTYSYQFKVNGCDTGYRSYASRDEMCEALRDNAGNYNCAYNERYAKFLNDCYDKQW